MSGSEQPEINTADEVEQLRVNVAKLEKQIARLVESTKDLQQQPPGGD